MKNIICFLICTGLFAHTPFAQDRFSDCVGAVILCDKSDLIVKKLMGPGKEQAEVGFTTCSGRLDERNSVWIKWQVAKSGSIEFIIDPLEPADDLDFVVYRLDGEFAGCSRKHEIRCLASGENIGAPEEDSYPCRGRMGLARNASDLGEGEGCGDRHDNYLAAIDAQAGEQYILYINNYSSGNGFKLEWGGDAAFGTPGDLHLPATDQTQMSKAIYFREGYHDGAFKTDWAAESIHTAFTGKTNGARAPNTFVACFPTDDNAVKNGQRETFEFGYLYPNPTSGDVSLPLHAPYPAVVRTDLFDLLGRPVLSREYIVDRGDQVLSLPVASFKPGLFLALIRAGDSHATRKLLVTNK